MQTCCFIGSDKNAGKTTAFNYIYGKMEKESEAAAVCVTGVGINGEVTDTFDGQAKPTIRLHRGCLFLTHVRHLGRHTGKYTTLRTFSQPVFRGHYVLGCCLTGFPIVLEGPNTGTEVLTLKGAVKDLLPEHGVLLIDGRDPQVERAMTLLAALRLPQGPKGICEIVARLKTGATRSLLFGRDGTLHYHGEQTPFSDEQLLRACESLSSQTAWLYLDGALSRTLADFLSPYANIDLLLDNFTLCQNRVAGAAGRTRGLSRIALLHPVRLGAVFVKQEPGFAQFAGLDKGLLPENVPVINLYRQGGWS